MTATPSGGWQIRGGRLLMPAPFLVAGIVNLTPDSFSDGGCFARPEDARARIREVIAQGADMLDLGAESTRPGAEDIGHAEEWRRLEPGLQYALNLRSGAERPFSLAVDTFRAETAARALCLRPLPDAPYNPPGSTPDGTPGSTPYNPPHNPDSTPDGTSGNTPDNTAALAALPGLDVINDVSGASFDPGIIDVVAQYRPGYVLGHSPARPRDMQVNPHYADVVDDLLDWFTRRLNLLVRAGLPEACVVLDPCIGFGKNLEHTLAIIRAIPRFLALGRPLYFGISRKNFLGRLTGLPVDQRDGATQAATALLAQAGVAIHRVHAVQEAVVALQIAAAFSDQGA